MILNLTFFKPLIWLLICVPLCYAQETCNGTGEWTTWSSWSDCPLEVATLFDFSWRQRDCIGNPPNCTAPSGTLPCTGNNFEIRSCAVTDPPITEAPSSLPTSPAVDCNNCTNVKPVTVKGLSVDGTNGWLILQYGLGLDGCRVLSLECYSITVGNTVSFVYNSQIDNNATKVVDTVTAQLQCSAGSWTSASQTVGVTTVACIEQSSDLNGTTVDPNFNGTTADSNSTATTVAPPTCTSCTNITVLPVDDTLRMSGIATQEMTMADNCSQLSFVCSSNNVGDKAEIESSSGELLADGTGNASLILTCQRDGVWQTADGKTISAILCAIPKPNCALCAAIDVGMVVADELQNGRVVMQKGPVGQCLQTNISCVNDIDTGTAFIISNKLAVLATGSNNTADISLTCNNQKVWETDNGALVAQIFCAIPKKQDPVVPTTAVVTTLQPTTAGPCSGTGWAEWQPWSTCTETCGACGNRTRTRECQKTMNDCTCIGNSSEGEVCNVNPCQFPIVKACCDPYVMGAEDGQIKCKLLAKKEKR